MVFLPLAMLLSDLFRLLLEQGLEPTFSPQQASGAIGPKANPKVSAECRRNCVFLPSSRNQRLGIQIYAEHESQAYSK